MRKPSKYWEGGSHPQGTPVTTSLPLQQGVWDQHQADGVWVCGTREGSTSQKGSRRWHRRAGAGSWEAPSQQLATHCWITQSGDLVLDTFPRGCPMEGWQFPIF